MFKTATLQLRRNRSHRPVSWLELFFDLIFVAAVAQVGEPLAHEFTPAGLFRYAFLFLLIWWSWLGNTMFSTRFESDDTLQRVLTFVQVFAAAVMAANAKEALSTRDAAGFGAAYALMRLVLVVQYLRGRKVKAARKLASLHAIGFGAAALLWFGAALLDTPERFYVWGIALAIDLATPMLSVHYTHKLPPDAAHIPERHGLFTIILIGESVTAVMRGIESQDGWTVSAASAAILGLCLAFLYWWWYFNHNADAERRRVDSAKSSVLFFAWSYAHFPLCLGIAVAGLGVKHMISLMAGRTHGSAGNVDSAGCSFTSDVVAGADRGHCQRGRVEPKESELWRRQPRACTHSCNAVRRQRPTGSGTHVPRLPLHCGDETDARGARQTAALWTIGDCHGSSGAINPELLDYVEIVRVAATREVERILVNRVVADGKFVVLEAALQDHTAG
jgi:low temperature requirement protein LtrA